MCKEKGLRRFEQLMEGSEAQEERCGSGQIKKRFPVDKWASIFNTSKLNISFLT